MKPVILILVCILLTNCSESNDCCTVIETDIGIEYINEKGEDLMNSNTVNHYNEKDIKVFYLVNGEKKEIIRGNLDNPRMFSLSIPHAERNYFVLSIILNDLSNEEVKTTYLQLSENDTDTITHTLQKTNSKNKIIDKVWYNSKISTDMHTFKIQK